MPEVAEPAARSLSTAAALITALSALSPFAGLLVETALAWRFGASGTVDAFRAASLLIGFASQVFVAYLLPHLVVPAISSYRARGEEEQGWRIAITFGQTLAGLALIFAAWIVIDPRPLTLAIAPGLTATTLSQALFLMRFFAAAFAIILWCGVITGILYIHRIFALAPLSQMLSNLIIVGAVLLLPGSGIPGIAAGVATGFGVMLVLHINALFRIASRTGIRLREAFRPAPWSSVGWLFIRSIPLLIIVAATILSNVVITNEISRLPTGNLARFGYASKLTVIATFAAGGLATVMFPALAEAFTSCHPGRFSELATRGIRMVLLLTVPLCAFFFTLKDPFIRLMFDRGALAHTGIDQVTVLFGILMFQMPAGNLNFFLLKVFFSRDDTRWPAAFHGIFLLAILAALPAATTTYGSPGILVAFVLVSYLLTGLLLGYGILRYQIARISNLALFSVKLAAVSLPVMAAAVLVERAVRTTGLTGLILNIAVLAAAGLITLPIAILTARLVHLAEAREIEGFVLNRVRRLR